MMSSQSSGMKRVKSNLGEPDEAEVDEQFSSGEPSLRHNICYISSHKRLTSLSLIECKLGDDDLGSVVGELPNLQKLDLTRNYFSRIDFRLLKLPRLKYLRVSGCWNLVELLQLPSSIAVLIAESCRWLESIGDISNCKWLWKVSLVRRVSSPVFKIPDFISEGNAIEDHFISLVFPAYQLQMEFDWDFKTGEIFPLQLPPNWYDDSCGFFICVYSNDFPCFTIILMPEMGKDCDFVDGRERYVELKPDTYSNTYVGYVSFKMLKRHTQASWWNSAYNITSFLIFVERATFGAKLVLRKSKGHAVLTAKAASDYSEFWDEQYGDRKTFTIQDDLNSSIKIVYPSEDIQRIYELFVSADDRYRGRGYDKGHEAQQKHVEIMEDMRDKVQAKYHMLKLQPEGPLSESVFTEALLLWRTMAGGKVTKSSLVVDKRGCLYMVKVHPKGIGAIINGSGSYVTPETWWFGEAEESFLHNVSEDKETTETAAGVAFGVAKRLSRTFKAENTGIRVEAPKILWADSVSTAYLIYRITYVPIGLRIPEEEWRGKDTSLTHLKAAAQMKCDTAFGIRRVTRLSEAEISHLWTRFIEPENDSIVAEHGSSSEFTQRAQVGAQIRVRGPKTVRVSRIVEDQMKNTLKTEHPPRREALRLHRLPARKKASQRLWMFKVKEEQNSSEKVQASWAERKPRVQIERNSVWTDSSTEATVDDMLVAGSDMEEFNKPKWVLIFVEDSWNEEPCIDVHQIGDEREVEVLACSTWPLDLLTLRLVSAACSVPCIESLLALRLVSAACSVCSAVQVRAVALLKRRWFEVYRDYLRRRAVK
ncbi:Toll/interleukin-1 receptor domain-containing protein [Tanacetum coccineum]